MGKNAKLGIAAGAVLVLALIAMALLGSTILALAVLVLGGLGIFVLKDRLPEDEIDSQESSSKTQARKGKQLKGKKALDALLESKHEDTKTKKSPSAPPAASSGEGLPTWGGGLDTWTPPSGDDIEVVEDEEPASGSDWDSWDNEWAEDGDTLTAEADDPLGNLDELADIDPIAEVERIDAMQEDEEFASVDEFESYDEDDTIEIDELEDEEPAPASSGGGFSFSSAPAVINEDVSTADDIMAASQATELGDEAADSELAKLLAKVQARLAAYE